MEETKMTNPAEFKCPRWDQLPDLDLYMDQVVNLIELKLTPLFGASGEKNITSTMINNYVKQHIIPSPIKKKYSKTHLAQLFVLFMMKNILSISEITALLSYMEKEADFAGSYDKFCSEMDMAIHIAFSADPEEMIHYTADMSGFGSGFTAGSADADSVYRAMALAFACKLYAQRILGTVVTVEADHEKKKTQEDGE